MNTPPTLCHFSLGAVGAIQMAAALRGCTVDEFIRLAVGDYACSYIADSTLDLQPEIAALFDVEEEAA